MKKRAIIYTRVSTDEQNNGYSPADQKDKLYKYCENNAVEVVSFYHDDESGKSFDRPEWKKIVHFLKKNRGTVDFIYVLKWDRFSRNVADAYIEIRELKRLGVEAQSIEQPLDFTIPESKIMLAIYLATPEVDNDRRALNILGGIRRAKKEGRWLGACLKGYKNTRDENNKPIIVPDEGKNEQLVKKAFAEFSTGLYNIEELRRKLNKEGLKSMRNSFWRLLRNKGYIGKIFVPAYKDEPATWVDGVHQPLIDEQTFYAVQDILEGRKKRPTNKNITVRDEFPLRGFLSCPQCGRALTASISKGHTGAKFNYYHCQKGCKERQPAKEVNNSFLMLLKEIKGTPESMNLYAELLKVKLNNRNKEVRSENEKLLNQMEKEKQRQKSARTLLLDGEITSKEFKEIKNEIEENITKTTCELNQLSNGIENSGKHIDNCLQLLKNLDKYYLEKDTAIKQRIISSMFPSKLIFENRKYRTPEINSLIPLICKQSKVFQGTKKRKHAENSVLSLGVDPERIELSSKQLINVLSTCLFCF